MRCTFCGDEGYAFAPLGINKDVWVPCPRCEAGARYTLEPRAAALLDGTDYKPLVVPLPEHTTPQQAKRMLGAISRTFYVGRDPQHTETAREKQEREVA